MFFDDSRSAYALRGVYLVKGKPERAVERGRGHTALSLRIKGNSVIHTESESLCAVNGSLSFFPAGADYIRETFGDEEYIVIHLDRFGSQDKKIVVLDGCENTYPLFDTLYREWSKGEGMNLSLCMITLYKIFGELSRKASGGYPNMIAAGVEHLENNFRDPGLTVARLAEKCHISEVYFRRVYRETFGISPINALTEKRFEYARDLLSSGYYSTKEVAAMSGFSDVKYFRTAFKKRFGITVGDFLKE